MAARKNCVYIPHDDNEWVRQQKPSVITLWMECWIADPSGSEWLQLNTKLKTTAFKQAKKQLSDRGLFAFKRETSILDARSTVCWMVKNLHGSSVKEFWGSTKLN